MSNTRSSARSIRSISSIHTVALLTALLASTLPGLSLAADAAQADHAQRKHNIEAQYKTDKAACKQQSGNARDVCQEEAKAKEKIALAELTLEQSGRPADRTKLLEVKAEAAYDVAKEKCDDHAGNTKDLCVQQAKADRTKALADAKMGKEIRESRQENMSDKADASLKVALEKCDAMAGDAKAACVASAKARFGKN